VKACKSPHANPLILNANDERIEKALLHGSMTLAFSQNANPSF
jgi:hypothetical protein